jgi:UDP-glucose 4-epimerase
MSNKTAKNPHNQWFITGGAGFIGSNIVDHLIAQGKAVTVYDNLSTGKESYFSEHVKNDAFRFIKGDLKDTKLLEKSMKGSDFVFHLAAHADVKSGFYDHEIDHRENLEVTQNVLEAMVKNDVKNIAFASTSSVYGNATVHPTPEDHPLFPTSLYGATKAAGEHYIHVYSSYYDMTNYIFRFVSWIGERYSHGIIYDVLEKLKKNPDEIELFSDGTPKKSSLYVGDGINAIFTVINKSKDQTNIYNIGNNYLHTIDEITDYILEAAGYLNTKKKWLGKKSNWKGDNEHVLLSIAKLESLGWKPEVTIKEGIRRTVAYLQGKTSK